MFWRNTLAFCIGNKGLYGEKVLVDSSLIIDQSCVLNLQVYVTTAVDVDVSVTLHPAKNDSWESNPIKPGRIDQIV